MTVQRTVYGGVAEGEKVESMKFIDSAGVEVAIDDGELRRLVDRFRESLKPFGLDRFVSRQLPRVIEMANGRFLVELRTMLLVIWYPEDLKKLENAGFDVVRVMKKSNKHAPCQMYYARIAWEIGGIENGNQ